MGLEGAATVRMDAGIASGTGTLTGNLQMGGGAPTFQGQVDATVQVGGFATMQTKIKTDGKSVQIEAGAQIPIRFRG